jgi:gamma-glutamyltranspeptidase/glutathione hydrolase
VPKQRSGIVAGGNILTAQVGAEVLREGGNAVDAAVAAMLTSFVAEPLLTGLGAGGYMTVASVGRDPVVLDFFVDTPGRGFDLAKRSPLEPVTLSFSDAVQICNVGASSCGVYGTPSGVCEAVRKFGTLPMSDLVEPAVQLAHRGIRLSQQQATLFEVLAPIILSTPDARSIYMVDGRLPRAGEVIVEPQLGETLERLGKEGEAPFYTGDIAAAVVEWAEKSGGHITSEDLRSYETLDLAPLSVNFRDREILTVPPPNAGGTLIAYTLMLLSRLGRKPEPLDIVSVLEAAQAQRTPEFGAGLFEPEFVEAFLAIHLSSKPNLGNTTHISVLDKDGNACSVTTTNGEGSGQIVPGTGIHLNNMLGEPDLSPLGFFSHPPGRRLSSMMAPSIVLANGEAELVVGSAGGHRIRSAILQVMLNVIEHGMDAEAAIDAPRLHFDDGIIYVEPGIDTMPLEAAGLTVARFPRQDLFFGGAQAVEYRQETGEVSGGGDPRRGGAAVVA